MNDEPDLDLWLRASAYLDGELDAVERARAEADPEVMAEVELLRMLQGELRQVDPPTGAARNSAIAAALRQFDSIYEPAATTANVRPVSPARSARSWSSMLTAVAAAVLIVAALGFVASRGLGGSDDDQDAGADLEASQFTAEEAGDTARSALEPASADAADAPAAEEAADAVFDAPADGGAAPEPTTLTAASATDAPEATMAPAADMFSFDADQPVIGEQQLALAGASLVEQQRTGELANTPETRCGTADESRPLEVLSPAQYTDHSGNTMLVLIAVDPATGDTLALDPATCEPVATAPAP